MPVLKVEIRVDKNTFTKVSKAVQDRVRQAVHEATEELAEMARLLAPVDTGALRDSITTEFSGNQFYAQGDVEVGADYAIYQEFGTRYFPPHPFLFPAADAIQETWDDRLAEAVNRGIAEGTSSI